MGILAHRKKTKAPGRSPAPFRCRLIVMAKVPEMGRVKTRLARDIGSVAATSLYRHLLSTTIARLARDPRWQTILAVAPDAGLASRALPPRVARMAQGRGDLGQRMQRLIERAPDGPTVLIGSDIPGVTPALIAGAFRALAGADAVVGPAADGGFWLVGLRRTRRVPRPFAGVRWSQPLTLAETLANLAGRRIRFAADRSDIDCGRDAAAHPGSGRRIIPR